MCVCVFCLFMYFYFVFFVMFWFEKEKMKTRKDKRMVKLECFSKLPFLDIILKQKSNTSTFGCTVIITLAPGSVYT